MDLGPDLITAVIDSILEHPEEWTFGNHTLDHKNGISIWHANTWEARKFYQLGSSSECSAYELTDVEKQTLDRAMKQLRGERNGPYRNHIKKSILDRLHKKSWFSWLSDEAKVVTILLMCMMGTFVFGHSAGVASTQAELEAQVHDVAPISSDSPILDE